MEPASATRDDPRNGPRRPPDSAFVGMQPAHPFPGTERLPAATVSNLLFARYLSGGILLPQLRAGSNIFLLADLLPRPDEELASFLRSTLSDRQITVTRRAMRAYHLRCGVVLPPELPDGMFQKEWSKTKTAFGTSLDMLGGRLDSDREQLAAVALRARAVVFEQKALRHLFVYSYSGDDRRLASEKDAVEDCRSAALDPALVSQPKVLNAVVREKIAQKVEAAARQLLPAAEDLAWLIGDLRPGSPR